ncbi:MAG: hypothetical protein K0Q49_2436 [Haloplasmataceae bacterium]|jgi:hypothetical protein|nr:hypothetical protein [Haloplasmataceae bacterium]
MKLKKHMQLILFLGIVFTPMNIKAQSDDPNTSVIRQFFSAIHDRDEMKLKSLVMNSTLKIPEIREVTPITSFQSFPSYKKENSRIIIGRFGEDYERFAFIWEVSFNDKHDKITKIKVISDLANPHMNEQTIVKKYTIKFKKDILVPAYFPFDVTHVTGKITGNEITLYYKNKDINNVLEIKASPQTKDHQIGYTPITIKNGGKVFIGKKPTGYGCIFIYDNMWYEVSIYKVHEGSYKPSRKELVKVVESMFPIQHQ